MTIRFKGGYHGSAHVLATTLINELFNFNVYNNGGRADLQWCESSWKFALEKISRSVAKT